METIFLDFVPSKTSLDNIRTSTKEEFIQNHASGTLRKAAGIGLKHNQLYWEERIAYEFGWEFQMVNASRVTVGPAMVEGDNKSSTEFGWHTERYMSTRAYYEDQVLPMYVIYEDEEGNRLEGNAIVVKSTSLEIPTGKIIFAIVAEYDENKGGWQSAVNPF